MSDRILLLAGGVSVLIAISLLAVFKARKADRLGELRFRPPGRFEDHVIRRADDPREFALNLMILRGVPWIAFGSLAFATALWGPFW